jgi:hypothetical protein
MDLGHEGLHAPVGRADLLLDDAGGARHRLGAHRFRHVGQLGQALVQRRHQHVLAGFRFQEQVDLVLGALEDEARREQALGGGFLRPRQGFVDALVHLLQARHVAGRSDARRIGWVVVMKLTRPTCTPPNWLNTKL